MKKRYQQVFYNTVLLSKIVFSKYSNTQSYSNKIDNLSNGSETQKRCGCILAYYIGTFSRLVLS